MWFTVAVTMAGFSANLYAQPMHGQKIASYSDIGIQHLLARYRTSNLSPTALCEDILRRIEANDKTDKNPIYIFPIPRSGIMARCKELAALKLALGDRFAEVLPLYGIPFTAKDNMDVAGYPTSAGAPAYTYVAKVTAHHIQKALDAGAILIGKSNLDQFATGLAGVRSGFGACRNPRNQEFITGGSSSGSAVAVAVGWSSFSFGTDTDGSGRVPAACNHLVGYKGTRGMISTHGTIPACASIDCNTIFALTSADALYVAQVVRGFDPDDPWSREQASTVSLKDPTLALNSTLPGGPAPFKFGVPTNIAAMEFFGDETARSLYLKAIQRLERIGGQKVEIDIKPFEEAALLLYGGPWVAERTAAVGDWIMAHEKDTDPATYSFITKGAKITAVEAYRALYKLMEYKRMTDQAWKKMDILVLPTTGTIYRIKEVEVDGPTNIKLNGNLGRYTNFANLLDTCAIALPAGFRAEGEKKGLPFGITLFANTFQDGKLFSIAERYEAAMPRE